MALVVDPYPAERAATVKTSNGCEHSSHVWCANCVPMERYAELRDFERSRTPFTLTDAESDATTDLRFFQLFVVIAGFVVGFAAGVAIGVWL